MCMLIWTLLPAFALRTFISHIVSCLFLQLAETLQAENPKVEITAIDVEREGICIRFAPLESAQGIKMQDPHNILFDEALLMSITTLIFYEEKNKISGPSCSKHC